MRIFAMGSLPSGRLPRTVAPARRRGAAASARRRTGSPPRRRRRQSDSASMSSLRLIDDRPATSSFCARS